MNRLDDPRLFLRVVEAGSMKAVAEEIGADPATVTRRVTALETRLKTKLLERSRQGASPTEAGTTYYTAMRRILAEVDAVEADIGEFSDTPRGLVRVSCPLDFGRACVTGWIVELLERHPELAVDLVLSDTYVDLVGQDVDVALRIGQLTDSALKARKLGEMRLMLVASPAYIEQMGRITQPQKLEACHFILYSWMQFGRTVPLQGPNGKAVRVSLQSRLSINNLGAAREATLMGAGIHIGPEWIFVDDVRSGRLVEMLPDWAPAPTPVHALFRSGDYLPAKSRAVIEHLADRFPRFPVAIERHR